MKFPSYLLALGIAICLGLQSFASFGDANTSHTTQDVAWSSSYNELLEVGAAHLAPPAEDAECEQEAAAIWNPISFSLTSGCAGSICVLSGCLASGCGGSGCVMSWCEGSACIDSGCTLSGCLTSGCTYSACVESGCYHSGCRKSSCQNSTCQNSNCDMSNCRNSGCNGSVCCPDIQGVGMLESAPFAVSTSSLWWENFDAQGA